MPPERLLRQCVTDFAEEVSLQVETEAEESNLAGNREEFAGPVRE
jgi:hypothetical protein